MCDKAVPMEVKMQVMAAFLNTIGVGYIAEKTAGGATALCRHFSVLVDDSPDKALSQQRRLKEILRCIWKDLPPCEVPSEYPPTPEEFLEMYPLWHRSCDKTVPMEVKMQMMAVS